MMLYLDAGNTRLKWGLRAVGLPPGTPWVATGALAHTDIATLADSLPQAPQRIAACNVAGPQARAAIEALAQTLRAPLAWLTPTAFACGVANGYDNPVQLGADRWAALIGARAWHAGDAVVVMAGTATTIDQLDAGGRFRGGLILPGLALMRGALARNTAGLPEARGAYREAPTNTDDAIAAGCLHATLGAIERMRGNLGGDAQVMLSGGAAGELAAHVAPPCQQVDYLVLEGLARWASA